ncbi:hypothetical protein [Streptomyces purpurogeneiscleroticus]|nr:hypothetical protein [Streptomyces purpurogeneiscleroticus]
MTPSHVQYMNDFASRLEETDEYIDNTDWVQIVESSSGTTSSRA